jgi:hypothetical protein
MITRFSLRSHSVCRLAPRRQSQARRPIAMAQPLISGDRFWLDTFCLRQFDDPNFAGTRVKYDKKEFVDRIHAQAQRPLVDGYAPFCKHIFVPNFVGACNHCARRHAKQRKP